MKIIITMIYLDNIQNIFNNDGNNNAASENININNQNNNDTFPNTK